MSFEALIVELGPIHTKRQRQQQSWCQQNMRYNLIVLFRQSDACNDTWKWVPDPF